MGRPVAGREKKRTIAKLVDEKLCKQELVTDAVISQALFGADGATTAASFLLADGKVSPRTIKAELETTVGNAAKYVKAVAALFKHPAFATKLKEEANFDATEKIAAYMDYLTDNGTEVNTTEKGRKVMRIRALFYQIFTKAGATLANAGATAFDANACFEGAAAPLEPTADELTEAATRLIAAFTLPEAKQIINGHANDSVLKNKVDEISGADWQT